MFGCSAKFVHCQEFVYQAVVLNRHSWEHVHQIKTITLKVCLNSELYTVAHVPRSLPSYFYPFFQN